MIKERIFRVPRLKTNRILEKFAKDFSGDIINVSGSNDLDKNASLKDYYFGNYDNGKRYKDYFINARSYTVSNYPGDKTEINLDKTAMLMIDLEKDIPEELLGKYDVVFNHTVFEHIFDVFTAFKNLCSISKDVIIFIVPQFQQIHDYERGYKDYWRFTPFSVDCLFKKNGYTVLYRETTYGFSESMYLFYIASKQPEKWREKFTPILSAEAYINNRNNGSSFTLFSKYLLLAETLFRKMFSIKRKNH